MIVIGRILALWILQSIQERGAQRNKTKLRNFTNRCRLSQPLGNKKQCTDYVRQIYHAWQQCRIVACYLSVQTTNPVIYFRYNNKGRPLTFFFTCLAHRRITADLGERAGYPQQSMLATLHTPNTFNSFFPPTNKNPINRKFTGHSCTAAGKASNRDAALLTGDMNTILRA